MPEHSLENIEIEQVAMNGTNKTKFTLTSYNRSKDDFHDEFELILDDDLVLIDHSEHSLSCIMVYDEMSNELELLSFKKEDRDFKILGHFSLSTFTANSLNISQIKRYFSVGEEC